MTDILWSNLDLNGVGGRVLWTMDYELGGTREDIPGPDGVKSQKKPSSPQAGMVSSGRNLLLEIFMLDRDALASTVTYCLSDHRSKGKHLLSSKFWR